MAPASGVHVRDDFGWPCNVTARGIAHLYFKELDEKVDDILLLILQPLIQGTVVISITDIILEKPPASILASLDLQLESSFPFCRHDIPIGLVSAVLHSYVVASK